MGMGRLGNGIPRGVGTMRKPVRVIGLLLATAAILVAALPAAAGAQTTSSPALALANVADPMSTLVNPGDAVTLSNETTVTRWANPNDVYPIRTEPTTSARTITKLRFLTEDAQPEVYLVLDGKLDAAGDPWLHIRIPMRPNGKTGWVPADYLSELHVVRTQLVVDRRGERATLYKSGVKIWSAPVGVGKSGTVTPAGNFYVRELLKGDGKVYGPWAFGTSDYSTLSDWKKGGVVGIHGTNEPQLIPGRPSHGCVRMRNNKIIQLRRLMPIGTPVTIIH